MYIDYSNVFFCRGLFIIDGKGILRQITMNDLPVSIYVIIIPKLVLFLGELVDLICFSDIPMQ